jgi:hypothetical protein
MIEYAPEYYELKKSSTDIFNAATNCYSMDGAISYKLSAIYFELQRLNIAIDKQNALLELKQ